MNIVLLSSYSPVMFAYTEVAPSMPIVSALVQYIVMFDSTLSLISDLNHSKDFSYLLDCSIMTEMN